MHICMNTYMYIYIYTDTHMYIYIYMYVYIYIYICIHVRVYNLSFVIIDMFYVKNITIHYSKQYGSLVMRIRCKVAWLSRIHWHCTYFM